MITKFSITLLLAILSMSSFANTLGDQLYQYAQQANPRDSATAFVVLSNLSLSGTQIQRIEQDYLREQDPKKRFYYAFLLSKRTRQ